MGNLVLSTVQLTDSIACGYELAIRLENSYTNIIRVIHTFLFAYSLYCVYIAFHYIAFIS